MIFGAHIEGPYRYALWRYWADEGLGPRPNVGGIEVIQQRLCPAVFMLLNPSYANAHKNDPTATRCIEYAKSWGHNGIIIVNPFALISTDPAALEDHYDPIGPGNSYWLDWAISGAGWAVAGWGEGVPKKHEAYVARLREKYRGKLRYLKLTKAGNPWHPLYLKGDLVPQVLT